ncbi:MAG: GNAT family N-acetyltransferase [Cyclobacteriaceae bacterium]|nr:GNAT family N-acetyltransferase [Cyclobacteriaceae bacterium]
MTTKEALAIDLDKIVKCHRSAFPGTLSSLLGKNVSYRTLEWYIDNPKSFLLWIEQEGVCIGYAGGMISDGSQVHGSASSMIQYAFKDAALALIVRPWLWLHPELVSRYKLILKNIYFKITGFKKPMKDRKNHSATEPHVGLVVIGVHPQHQGKGYGSLLLKAFQEKVVELGFSKMSLTVLAENSQAIKSYMSNGWLVYKHSGKSVSMQKRVTITK